MEQTLRLPDISKLSQTTPVAIKKYLCIACGEPIEKGTRHLKYRYIDNDALAGRFRTIREHFDCHWESNR